MRFPFFNKRESTKDLKRGQGRVVFLGKSKKYSEWSSRIFEFTKLHPIELGVLFVAAFLIYSFTARGSALVFHPATCAGGWQNAQNAQGVPELSAGADLAEFTPANSALFVGGVQSIDCSAFSGIQAPEGTAIEALSLSFSLGVKKVSISANPEGDSPAPIDGGVQLILNPDGSSVDSSSTTSDQVTPSETIILPEQSVTPIPAETPAQQEASSSASVPSTQQEAAPPAPVEQVTPAAPASSGETPAQQEAAPPAPVTPVENGSPSSWFVPVALAQEAAPTSESEVQSIDIVQSSLPLGRISYSFDGSVWYDLGVFDERSFASLVYQIPVLQGSSDVNASSTTHGPEIMSWADIAKLRVRIDSDVLTLDTRYEVYFDGVSLEASYTETPKVLEVGSGLEVQPASSSATLDVLPVTSTTSSALIEEAPVLLPEQLPLINPTQSPFVYIPSRALRLLTSRSIPSIISLPWQDVTEARARLKDLSGRVSVSYDAEREDIVLDGTCNEDYYVVLVFRGANDYKQRPGSAIYNSASICNGAFSVALGPIVESIGSMKAGTYYLLVASQSETGAWIPISSVVPFQVE